MSSLTIFDGVFGRLGAIQWSPLAHQRPSASAITSAKSLFLKEKKDVCNGVSLASTVGSGRLHKEKFDCEINNLRIEIKSHLFANPLIFQNIKKFPAIALTVGSAQTL